MKKFQLPDRVIRARKLHMSRFFSLDMNYGHTQYLLNLHNQKVAVAQALQRLEHRTTEVSSFFCFIYGNLTFFRLSISMSSGSSGCVNARMTKRKHKK